MFGKIVVTGILYLLFISALPTTQGEPNPAPADDYEDDDYVKDDDAQYTSDAEHVPIPTFTTQPVVKEVNEGDSLTLECKTEKPLNNDIIWKRSETAHVSFGNSVLKEYADRYKSTDNGATLTINNIQVSDSGRFMCEIVITDNLSITLNHTIYVRQKGGKPLPPRLSLNPEDTKVVTQDDNLNLTCSAISEGKQAEFRWVKKDAKDAKHEVSPSKTEITKISDRVSTNTLIFKNIQWHDAGDYVCIYKDDIGTAESVVRVEVNFPPFIETKQDQVHSDIGKAVELECIGRGQPRPTLAWYKGASVVRYRDEIRSQGGYEIRSPTPDVSRLIIKNVTGQDYGDYTCEAHSTLFPTKNASAKIKISGAPSQPVIIPERTKLGQEHMSFQLVWKFESSFPVERTNIRYRKMDGAWEDVNVVAVPVQNQVGSYEVEYTLRNLTSSSHYEATLLAKNKEGLSPPARTHVFYINGKNYESPEASKANGKASIFQGGSQIATLTFSLLFLILMKNGVTRWV